MRLFRPCFIAGWLYPGAIFRVKTEEKSLYLTFDDGPDPDSTPLLLEILERNDVKAIFFCDGRSAEKYPGLVSSIVSSGHIIGNHGYAHPDGWKTSTASYVEDVSRAAGFLESTLFRPPFGRIRLGQYIRLRKKYKIVFWDIMAYDFDKNFDRENSLRILKKLIRPGSVIVLHDKPESRANAIIDEFITFALSCGYRFEVPG